jgi:hypothetical protein
MIIRLSEDRQMAFCPFVATMSFGYELRGLDGPPRDRIRKVENLRPLELVIAPNMSGSAPSMTACSLQPVTAMLTSNALLSAPVIVTGQRDSSALRQTERENRQLR